MRANILLRCRAVSRRFSLVVSASLKSISRVALKHWIVSARGATSPLSMGWRVREPASQCSASCPCFYSFCRRSSSTLRLRSGWFMVCCWISLISVLYPFRRLHWIAKAWVSSGLTKSGITPPKCSRPREKQVAGIGHPVA